MSKALGFSVAEAQRKIDSHEFAEWLAYDRISPIGEERQDLNAGIISATIANAHAAKGRHFKAADFMPDFEKPYKRASVEEMMMRVKMAFGGKIRNGSNS